MKIVTFGELLLRLAAPGYTKLLQKDSFDATFCGSEANVAVSLANFGVNASFVTKLPDNDVGIAAVRSLNYFGVDTSDIVYGNGRMGLYYLEKGASQRPSKVIYDREYSAIALSKRSEFDWDRLFNEAKWFHWTGITPALSDELAEICLEACKIAKNKGLTVSCDLNYRKKLWTSDKAKEIMSKLMPYVDLCIANEEDADKVLSIKAEKTNIENGIINNEAYEQVAKEICRSYGCKYVAFTLRRSYSASMNGWSGMLYCKDQDTAFYSNEYNIQIVDRVGGGDSFSGALIYSLLSDFDNQQCIDFAVAASCLKHSIEGDYNRVTVQDVESLINNGGNGRVQR
ncbi:sugar kinase [Ruminococcus flavefaciens]|uniref:2-dehydro-3-deoxygluconokinase n=1 Tax=Ruminococcus flavefaciens TaxID=1265 RepID=A0A1M7IAT3_RUMFL|nr:sugar kinase [Ruminococcus flavefaciens]SHM37864.1 2-dehydro-3-deoxygluconokinase [Ruminococcus flavefaciens]